MWSAIRNAAAMVKSEGYFHVTLYISGDQYNDHLRMKFLYALLDTEGKKQMLFNYLKSYESQGKDVFIPKDKRGMNYFNENRIIPIHSVNTYFWYEILR